MKIPGVVVLLFASLIIVGPQPIKAEEHGEIIINANGTLNLQTAPIEQTTSSFSLIGDVDGSITVYASNIVLDGTGHSVAGIFLQETQNVTIKNFVVVSSQGDRIGISLSDASNNIILNNTVSGFWSIQALNGILYAGLYVNGGRSNTIIQNTFSYNLVGIDLVNTSKNIIVQNNITSSTAWSPYTKGLYFGGSSNNTIHHNNIVNNTYQAQTSNSANVWDNGSSNGGNYWSDHAGDSAYVIDEQNIDHYPLMQPYSAPSPQIPSPKPTNNPASQPMHLPMDIIVTSIAAAAVAITLGSILYYKKRRR